MSTPPDQKYIESYEAFLAFNDIVRKGKNNPYTSLNGHMYSFLLQDGVIALRLSKEDRQAFMDEYGVKQPISHNTVMKEYVELPGGVIKDEALAKKYLRASQDYIQSLKPKPTARKK